MINLCVKIVICLLTSFSAAVATRSSIFWRLEVNASMRKVDDMRKVWWQKSVLDKIMAESLSSQKGPRSEEVSKCVNKIPILGKMKLSAILQTFQSDLAEKGLMMRPYAYSFSWPCGKDKGHIRVHRCEKMQKLWENMDLSGTKANPSIMFIYLSTSLICQKGQVHKGQTYVD